MDDTILNELHESLLELGSVLPESFCRMTGKRLERIGFQVSTNEDAWDLAFHIRKTEVEVLDECHTDLVPSALYLMLCDRACGNYLYALKQTGKLDMETLDLSGVLTSLSEGDVSLSFDAGASDESRLNSMLELMMNSGKGQLKCYRKLRF